MAGPEPTIETFDVDREGRLISVAVSDDGTETRSIEVAAQGTRGLESSDGQLAYDAAFEVATQIDCAGGRPMKILTKTAQFEKRGEPTVFSTPGVWLFQGRCG